MARHKISIVRTDSKVAKVFDAAVNNSHKSQIQIASEIGFGKPNMISMIKQGSSKLPISKVQLAAESLGLDARELLTLCMEEYLPEEWHVIKDVYKI